tara:strand:+ start:1575 stop:1850 length:276 start_codon:yes stop_codon:yes gene_type:complete
MSQILITDTAGFLKLATDSEDRNRGPSQGLLDILHPDGLHVLSWQMDHNGVELRCFWLVKTTEHEEPIEITMDNSYEAIEDYTYPHQHDER